MATVLRKMFINIFSMSTDDENNSLIFDGYANAPVVDFYPEKIAFLRRFEFFQIGNVLKRICRLNRHNGSVNAHTDSAVSYLFDVVQKRMCVEGFHLRSTAKISSSLTHPVFKPSSIRAEIYASSISSEYSEFSVISSLTVSTGMFLLWANSRMESISDFLRGLIIIVSMTSIFIF